MKQSVFLLTLFFITFLFGACQKMEWREDVFLEVVSINEETYDSNNSEQREVENGDTLLVKYMFECPTGFAELFCSPNFEEDYSNRILVAPEEGDLEGEIVFQYIVEEVIPEEPIGVSIQSVMRCSVIDQNGNMGEVRFQFSKPV